MCPTAWCGWTAPPRLELPLPSTTPSARSTRSSRPPWAPRSDGPPGLTPASLSRRSSWGGGWGSWSFWVVDPSEPFGQEDSGSLLRAPHRRENPAMPSRRLVAQLLWVAWLGNAACGSPLAAWEEAAGGSSSRAVCANRAAAQCGPACPSNELCFTQVSCGLLPDGGSVCTDTGGVGGDDRCHRSCQLDGESCPAGEVCRQRPFFACTDFNGWPEGHGLCLPSEE